MHFEQNNYFQYFTDDYILQKMNSFDKCTENLMKAW